MKSLQSPRCQVDFVIGERWETITGLLFGTVTVGAFHPVLRLAES